jgi:DNA replication protein DnaC
METNLLLKAYLKKLRLPTVARDLEKMAAEAARTHLPYERFLLVLLEHEVLQREENTLKLRLKRAAFPVLKTLETFDFSAIPSLNKHTVLELTECGWIENAQNVILAGTSGVGKSHVATALGIAACRKECNVRFFTAAKLVNTLLEAQAAHSLSRLERQLLRTDLLIIDELGYVPFSKAGGEHLFGVIADRHERRSTLVTTNLDFSQWTEVFGNERMTGALVDRLTHNAHILKIVGESYRFRVSQQMRSSRTKIAPRANVDAEVQTGRMAPKDSSKA